MSLSVKEGKNNENIPRIGETYECEPNPISFAEYCDFRGLKRRSHLEEALGCANLTIVTHDESAVIEEGGHRISVVPAWRYLLKGCAEF